jgi:ABC-type transporter Mla MlaB component
MLSFNCNRAAADSNPPQPPNVLSHFVDWVHTRKSSLGIIHERRDESIDLSLEGAVDISCAVELKAALVDALTSGMPVRIALDRCSALDVTAYQLLWTAEREARSLGVELTLVGPLPAHLLAALKEVGFDSFPVPA